MTPRPIRRDRADVVLLLRGLGSLGVRHGHPEPRSLTRVEVDLPGLPGSRPLVHSPGGGNSRLAMTAMSLVTSEPVF